MSMHYRWQAASHRRWTPLHGSSTLFASIIVLAGTAVCGHPSSTPNGDGVEEAKARRVNRIDSMIHVAPLGEARAAKTSGLPAPPEASVEGGKATDSTALDVSHIVENLKLVSERAAALKQAVGHPRGFVQFPQPFKCTEKVIKYTIHGGWGNQVAGLRRALLVAAVLNRTLVVPPLMKHSELAYGACSSKSTEPNAMRSKAELLYQHISGKTGSSSIDLFDTEVLGKIVRTVGWMQWKRQCSRQVGEARTHLVQHNCRIVSNHTSGQDVFKWDVPKDVHTGSPALADNQVLGNGPWEEEDLSGMPPGYADFKERLTELRKVNSTLMHFGTLFPSALYTDGFLGISHHVVGRYLVYHPSLWEIPCRIARDVAPFATIHVRGGDGKFKRRMHFLKAVHAQIASVATSLSMPQTVQYLDGLAKVHDATFDQASKPGKNGTFACGRKKESKVLRLMLITDMKWGVLGAKMETNLSAFGENVLRIAGQMGWSVKTASTRSDAGSAAIDGLQQVPRVQEQHPAFVPLALDIMLGVLADVGFAGSLDSTLSRHVDQMRAAFNRSTLCAAHDAKAFAESEDSVCPGKEKTGFDKEVVNMPFSVPFVSKPNVLSTGAKVPNGRRKKRKKRKKKTSL